MMWREECFLDITMLRNRKMIKITIKMITEIMKITLRENKSK